jgi:stage II sporulation protein E
MKDGASMSGDNVSVFSTEEGFCYICLSDGMGSGPAAGKESDMVVDLMEKFMEAGFSEEAAIRIMNSAMVLKGEDEAYTTLDFARIDLYTGMLELTKIGAAASFIRHGTEVECLAVASLPAGAYVSEPCEAVRRKLRNGDFLVMVTDGVLEYLHVKKPEEKVAALIGEIGTDNAETLANTLLERILLFNGGHAPDDMTIVVTGIWEK